MPAQIELVSDLIGDMISLDISREEGNPPARTATITIKSNIGVSDEGPGREDGIGGAPANLAEIGDALMAKLVKEIDGKNVSGSRLTATHNPQQIPEVAAGEMTHRKSAFTITATIEVGDLSNDVLANALSAALRNAKQALGAERFGRTSDAAAARMGGH